MAIGDEQDQLNRPSGEDLKSIVPNRQIRVEYVYDEETGLTAAEQGLIKIGRGKDWPWLFDQLYNLSDDEILYRFKKWPSLVGPEGVWGTITVGPYLLMCQLEVPESHERALGKQVVFKVDLVGHEEEILRRIRELGG